MNFFGLFRRFRPSPLLTLAALLLMALTARLAVWQFERAEQKAALEQAAAKGIAAVPMEVRPGASLRPFQSAIASGVYLAEFQIRIDNRPHQRRPGEHIVAPLLLDGGEVIAVNRGWIPKNSAPPPPPAGMQTVRGVLQKDQSDAFTLSSETEQGDLWQNLDLTAYAAHVKRPMMTLALLAADGGGGLEAVAPRTDFKSARSEAYAWQWLTFCALTFVFYIALGMRKQ